MSDVSPTGCEDCKHEEELALLRLRVTELSTSMITDELTGLFNYRHLIQTLGLEIERVHRSGEEFSILMIDFDNFKHVNDIYGHEFGNQVLRAAGTFYLKSIRKLDVPCRFGGEEFVIVLPGTDLREAVQLAERLRQGVEALPLQFEQHKVTVTVSTGVEVFRARDQLTADQLINRADRHLLRAKQTGKNTVCFAEFSGSTKGMSIDEREALLDGFSHQDS
jgi:diguanylate cyclase (GGDEF)-like protein